jgi:hypothetical protein
MVKWYSIVFVSMWICIPEMSYPSGLSEHYHSEILRFTQNDTNKSAESTVKNNEKETKGKTSNKEKDDPQKRKQLKPFVPSETIPADQGVDFPYDI